MLLRSRRDDDDETQLIKQINEREAFFNTFPFEHREMKEENEEKSLTISVIYFSDTPIICIANEHFTRPITRPYSYSKIRFHFINTHFMSENRALKFSPPFCIISDERYIATHLF